MSVYANHDDLNNFFSTANITDWADKDRDGSLNSNEQGAIDAAILAAEGIIDGYLVRAGYAAPFDSSSFANLPQRLQSLIQQWTVIIAGYHIYSWHGLRDKVNPLEKLYQQSIKHLKELAAGLSLAGLSANLKVSFGTGINQNTPTDQLGHLKNDAWDW